MGEYNLMSVTHYLCVSVSLSLYSLSLLLSLSLSKAHIIKMNFVYFFHNNISDWGVVFFKTIGKVEIKTKDHPFQN